MNKKCTECLKLIDASQFRPNRTRKDRLNSVCTGCEKDLQSKGVKYCSTCKKTLTLSHFRKNISRRDGINPTCIRCEKEFKRVLYTRDSKFVINSQKEKRRKIKLWYKEYKKTLKCKKCGENHPACLHFHHVDRSKKEFTVSSMITGTYSKKRILEEIEKCEILCANCHAKEHWNDDLNIPKDNCSVKSKSKKVYVHTTKKPPESILKMLLWKMPSTEIAKQYSVSDKAVEKWAKSYGLSKPPRGYWTKIKAN